MHAPKIVPTVLATLIQLSFWIDLSASAPADHALASSFNVTHYPDPKGIGCICPWGSGDYGCTISKPGLLPPGFLPGILPPGFPGDPNDAVSQELFCLGFVLGLMLFTRRKLTRIVGNHRSAWTCGSALLIPPAIGTTSVPTVTIIPTA